MRFSKSLFGALFILALSFVGSQRLGAQTSSPNSSGGTPGVSPIPESGAPVSGVSELVPEVRKGGAPLPLVYDPVNPEFWKDVQTTLTEENYEKLVALGASLADAKTLSTDEGAEGALAAALGLQRLKLSYAATFLLKDLVRKRAGSMISHRALQALDEITRDHFYDREDIGDDFLASNEFGDLHPDTQSFVSYHLGMYLLVNGMREWADREFQKIRAKSHWDYQYQYLTALGEVARDRLGLAYERLLLLQKNPEVAPSLKTKVDWQIARVFFEKGEFEKAYELETSLKGLPPRERGRLILERAWAKYYLKDYDKALGLLEALKAPLFRDSFPTYEAYILRMVIYKQLCHYESVMLTASEFRDRFHSAFYDMKKRKPLRDNPILARLALLNQRYQWDANLINQLREERRELETYDWEDFAFYKSVVASYKGKEAELQKRLDLQLEQAARRVAEQLIDAEEQVTFLDYSSKLDSLRIVRKGENRDYKSEKITYLSFERMFWPVTGEYWTDELEDFKVLVQSRCGETLGRPKDKEFE